MTGADRLILVARPPELFDLAARRFAAAVGEAVEARGTARVALSGGSTPSGLYGILAGADFRARVAWDRIHFYWGDERCVPPDHASSNYGMARNLLLAHLPILPANVHRMPGEMEPAAGAARYQAELEADFAPAPGEPPIFDWILLGLGADGHTASLFPQSPVLQVVDRWVAAVRPPGGLSRLTLTLPVLNAARQVHFLATGEEKARMFLRASGQSGEPGPDCPASLVRPKAGRLVWMVDPGAAILA
jgi:6-phosphogluconolactonase